MDVSSTVTRYATLRTLPLQKIKITGGFWQQQQATNHAITLHDGYRKLEQAGNFANLRHAAHMSEEAYQGPVFMDEDVYKWLEAVSHEIGNTGDPELVAMADETIGILAAAQMEDGYLDSYYQVVALDLRWTDLDHGHEMYCAGHLIQAAVAHHRATGSDALLSIARRFADHIDSIFGPDKRHGTCGHPEIETALVELHRETGEERYLALAEFLVDQRGKNKMAGFDMFGPGYHQDRVPVRDAVEVEGHAVRQLYLAAGVTDLYMQTGEQRLFDAMQRLWHDATAHKMFITGGYGSRYEGESFGDSYELPSDRCYCETCAAIGSLMWNWRLLIATGEARFADELERVLYNGFLSGRALDAQHYFYMNPLESREGSERPAWHRVACCPPNIMRQIATVGHYIATADESGVQIHQYMSATLQTGSSGKARTLRLETDYPWDGQLRITVEESTAVPWKLRLRVPAWCQNPELKVNGASVGHVSSGTYAEIEREWAMGDIVELSLPMRPQWIEPNPRVDAVRGSVALMRGPLVYCLEATDQPAGTNLLDVQVDATAAPKEEWQADLLGGVVSIDVSGELEDAAAWQNTLYRPLTHDGQHGTPITLTAIPYYSWANRGLAAMRVWLPQVEK